jgi:hypothetical protein
MHKITAASVKGHGHSRSETIGAGGARTHRVTSMADLYSLLGPAKSNGGGQ